jgi:putative ABC transport system permease protein
VSGYFMQLALQNLRRHIWLTTLIVLAVSLGLGSSMTVYSILRAMSADPIPWKSDRLLTVQIDNFGPDNRRNGQPPVTLTYRDVTALKRDGRGIRQAGMYEIAVSVTSEGSDRPLVSFARGTHADFFAMFDVPFVAGQPWSAADDEARANVVVLTRDLAAQLFPAGKAVGGVIRVENQDYRVVGVTEDWEPSPRFYDVGFDGGDAYGQPTTLFMPFETAVARNIQANGSVTCQSYGNLTSREGFLASECVWAQYWLEVATAGDIPGIRDYLHAYAAEQQRTGRFNWSPLTRVHNVRQWMDYMKVAPDQLRVATWVAIGFLVVCLVNAVALMLARSSRRAAEFSLRRALGASRRDLFLQGIWESMLIGAVGGAAGLLWTWGGLSALRRLVPEAIVETTALQPAVVALTAVLAIAVTVLAGLFPAWRASRTAGALRLKSL